MSKNRHIKIPLPKWKWWQTALAMAIAILASKVEPMEALNILKELLKTWLLNYNLLSSH